MFLANSGFPDYRRIAFGNLKVNQPVIKDGLHNILASSILFLKSPNNHLNLCFRTPSADEWDNVTDRSDFQQLMIPAMSLEVVCDLTESFVLDTPTSHIVKVFPNRENTSNTQFVQFNVEFETLARNRVYFQQQYSNAIWYMHLQNDNSPSTLQLKLDDNSLKNNCVLVFTKTSFFAFDENNQEDQMTNDPNGDQVISINMRSYVCKTDENQSALDSILQAGNAKMTFIGQIVQFLKGLKILSVPNRPANIPATEDYNLSPVFDALINPNLFIDIFRVNANDDFNEKFVQLMKTDKLSLLIEDGAPGTGKTTIACRAIVEYICNSIEAKEEIPRFLVTAPSNAAADVFYLKLHHRLPSTVRICRLGETEKFKTEVRELAKTDFDQFAQQIQEENGNEISKRAIKHEFVLSSTIVIVTLGSSQSNEIIHLRNQLKFDLLVVDEAGQAKIEEFLFPLHLVSIHRLLLVGDPRQLGPTLKSSLMMNLNNDKTSIFVKLCNYFQANAPNVIFRLREQHRMRHMVANMVSCISYADADRLTTDPAGNWTKTNSHPALLVFSGESWREKRSSNSFSYENRKEAEFGIALLCASLRLQGFNFNTRSFPNGKQITYGVIALYRGQVNLYRRLLINENLYDIVKVYTVDQMQGSECDIAIVSAVRASTEHHSVGFASDLRRLNVALSRAACVYVLAKYDDFKTHQGWSKLFHEAIRHNLLYPDADVLLVKNLIGVVLNDHASKQLTVNVNI